MTRGNGTATDTARKGGYFLRPSSRGAARDGAVARRQARRAAAAAARAVTGKPRLDVARPRGKNILLIGTTGFVGKVALSMLLHRYPDVGKVFVPGAARRRQHRRRALLHKKVASSGVRPAARRARRRLRGVPARARSSRSPATSAARCATSPTSSSPSSTRHGGLDVIINCAGLVSFTPSLESALRINAMGAKNVLERRAQARRRAGPRLDLLRRRPARRRGLGGRAGRRLLPAHERSARLATTTSCSIATSIAAAEIADCQKIIEQARERVQRPPAHLGVPRARRASAARRSAAIPTTRTTSSSRSRASARSG